MEEKQQNNTEIIEKLGQIEKSISQIEKKSNQLELDRKIDLRFNIYISIILGFMIAAVVSSLFFVKQASMENYPTLFQEIGVLIGTLILFFAIYLFILYKIDYIREKIKESFEKE